MPPQLYIYKLEYLRDKLLPPPELGHWVDISRLRRWLDHCNNHHSAHCQFSSESKQIFKHRPLRLIDLKRMCLVPSKPRQRYVALSYVWGVGTAFKTLKQNIHRLQHENSFQSRHASTELPTTIRDVMELTRQIGEQFLWVDSLCIVQDDDRERRDQLDCMGSIYANAYVTIVAAGGTAFSGLRGIKDATPPMARAPEVPHYLRHSQARWLHLTLQKSHRKLQASAWNHRAWTFQEQIFSRRLLVFDNTSVAWECHCAVWIEGMEANEGQCQNNREMVAQGFSFGIQPSLRDYARHVAEFNRRELSYPEDALDAFGGILTTLSSTAFVGGFICGLPAMFFDAALLWYSESPLERRQARRPDANTRSTSTSPLPPSWAWAAWGGTVSFPGYEHKHNVASAQDVSVRPLVQWDYRANDKEQWQSIRSASSGEPQRIHAGLDQPEVLVVRSSASNSQGHNNEEDDVGPPSSIRGVGSHLLLARPWRTFFRVMEIVGGVQVLLTDGLDNCAGMLSSCEALNNDENTLLCEVVAVSESFVNGNDVYNAIWIEWEDGIAYRKGVGRILKSAWEAEKSERINLILG